MNLNHRNTLRTLLTAVVLSMLLIGAVHPRAINAACTPGATAAGDVITCDGSDDYVDGLGGNDTISGGGGDDSIAGGAGADTLNGNTGDDILEGDGGNDELNGGAGYDDLFGNAGDDILNGGADGDDLYGGAGNDTINGGDDNDYIIGGAGDDTLNGQGGDDLFVFDGDTDTGTDSIDGGNGVDQIGYFNTASNVTIDLSNIYSTQSVTSTSNLNLMDYIEDVTTGSGDDTVYGNNLANYITTNGGQDIVYGYGGADTIFGGNGADSLYGGDGADTLVGEGGADYLSGGDGTDALYGGDGADELDGGDGADYLTGGIGNDWMYGGAGADSLYGEDGNDHLYGEGGDDFIVGGAGNDVITPDGGDDTVYGGEGDDILHCGPGNDYVNGEAGDDIFNNIQGLDTLVGGDGNDTFTMNGEMGTTTEFTEIFGGTGSNLYEFMAGATGWVMITTTSGEDYLDFSGYGTGVTIDLSSTEDQEVAPGLKIRLNGDIKGITGTSFNDTITGNGADNTILGIDGDDTLNGGAGADILDGGDGTDSTTGTDAEDTYINIENHTSAESPAGSSPETVTGEQSVVVVVNSTATGGSNSGSLASGKRLVFQLLHEDRSLMAQAAIPAWSAPTNTTFTFTELESSAVTNLPDGSQFAGPAFSLAGVTPANESLTSVGGSIEIKLQVPAGTENGNLTVMYFDASTGSWRALSTVVSGGYAYAYNNGMGMYALVSMP